MRKRLTFDHPENHCFGCAADNAAGLKLEFFETDSGVEAEYRASADFVGAPGTVHGGIQATLLDEVMCMAAYAKLGRHVVTGELTIRYLRRTPAETTIIARARITQTKGASAFIEGTIHLAGTDEELTQARGRFFSGSGEPFPAA
ncbi:MAG TPA: PaaI family thioesterase [Terriglobales bacterium]|nr:PaaI family thioesterase [Terriglobales bacterium]